MQFIFGFFFLTRLSSDRGNGVFPISNPIYGQQSRKNKKKEVGNTALPGRIEKDKKRLLLI